MYPEKSYLRFLCCGRIIKAVQKYDRFKDEANRIYMEMLEEESDGLYIQDIMRGGIQNDDPRIPRNVSE